jgi:hypothetical protein
MSTCALLIVTTITMCLAMRSARERVVLIPSSTKVSRTSNRTWRERCLWGRPEPCVLGAGRPRQVVTMMGPRQTLTRRNSRFYGIWRIAQARRESVLAGIAAAFRGRILHAQRIQVQSNGGHYELKTPHAA